ncbi:MAG: NUDIX domain-containing protein [Pseudomonadota bacterium]
MSPEVKEDLIQVIAAVIRKGSTYLVCRRPWHKRHGGLWEFPGGKVRKEESFRDAIGRELKEELQVDVTGTGESLYATLDPGTSFRIEFIETTISREPRAVEHLKIRWCSPAELISLPLAPADDRFVKQRIIRDRS